MRKVNVRVSVGNQARVFNVECKKVLFIEGEIYRAMEQVLRAKDELMDVVADIATRCAPKYCTVTVNSGYKRHRGKAITILDLAAKLEKLHFYHYVEREREVERHFPIATFYKKPFSADYVDHIGATFFNDINEKVITDVPTALNEVVPYYLCLAKSGSYYCWARLDMKVVNVSKFTDAPQYRWQLYEIRTVTKKYKVKVEYETPNTK